MSGGSDAAVQIKPTETNLTYFILPCSNVVCLIVGLSSRYFTPLAGGGNDEHICHHVSTSTLTVGSPAGLFLM